MNYRHIYHAGNFADVFKHSILVLLLENLLSKDSPFCYIDTHAGIGRYDLKSPLAQKALEYTLGISRLLNSPSENQPLEIAAYLEIIKKLNRPVLSAPLDGDNIKYYPGSPLIARSLLRPQDRMVLMELHQEDILSLKQLFFKDAQVNVHYYDGYQGLKAFLPPRERRGLVLIDPAFEQKNEFDTILSYLKLAYSRWPTGIYAIWYPIKDFTLVDNFLHGLAQMNIKYLVNQITIDKPTILKEFIGCGMVIINPPWQVDKVLKKVLPWLWKFMSPNLEGGVKVFDQK